jgi:hypothetical protein
MKGCHLCEGNYKGCNCFDCSGSLCNFDPPPPIVESAVSTNKPMQIWIMFFIMALAAAVRQILISGDFGALGDEFSGKTAKKSQSEQSGEKIFIL